MKTLDQTISELMNEVLDCTPDCKHCEVVRNNFKKIIRERDEEVKKAYISMVHQQCVDVGLPPDKVKIQASRTIRMILDLGTRTGGE